MLYTLTNQAHPMQCVEISSDNDVLFFFLSFGGGGELGGWPLQVSPQHFTIYAIHWGWCLTWRRLSL